MTRQEAAAQLNISVRTLDRHIKSGLLAHQYTKGKTGQMVDITPEALAEFRLVTSDIPLPSGASSFEPANDTALAIPDKALPAAPPLATALFMAHMQALTDAVLNQREHRTAADLGAQLLLTPEETATYAGVSENSIRAAIKDGTLPARKQGRGWKIRPADARAWVDRMFES